MDHESYNQVEALLRLFRERGLTELRVEEGPFKLHLRRGRDSAAPHPAPRAVAHAGAPSRAQSKARPARNRGSGRTVAVRSPLIGVFYRAAAPDAPPFVELGDLVSEGQTVCIVEAMKVFNEIKAEWRGRVVAIPVSTGALVQAGDPLVVLEFTDGAAQEEA